MKEESSSCFLLNRSLEYLSSEPISFLFDSNIHDSEMNVNSFYVLFLLIFFSNTLLIDFQCFWHLKHILLNSLPSKSPLIF